MLAEYIFKDSSIDFFSLEMLIFLKHFQSIRFYFLTFFQLLIVNFLVIVTSFIKYSCIYWPIYFSNYHDFSIKSVLCWNYSFDFSTMFVSASILWEFPPYNNLQLHMFISCFMYSFVFSIYSSLLCPLLSSLSLWTKRWQHAGRNSIIMVTWRFLNSHSR